MPATDTNLPAQAPPRPVIADDDEPATTLTMQELLYLLANQKAPDNQHRSATSQVTYPDSTIR